MKPPGDWRPVGKPMSLIRARCCWCKRQGLPWPTPYRIMADGDDPFAALASPVCARCATAVADALRSRKRKDAARAWLKEIDAGKNVD